MTEQNRHPVSDEEKRAEQANENMTFWVLAGSVGVLLAAQDPTISSYFKENQTIILEAAGTVMGVAMGVLGYRINQAVRRQNPRP